MHNKPLSSGISPDHLKYSEIKPLFKKGSKLNISNYRPISLSMSFSKVWEKDIYIQLLKHINKNNILAEEQIDFRTQSTTDKAMFKLTKEMLKAINNKSKVGGIFCYLKKAFDWVIHQALLSHLEFYGANVKLNYGLNHISVIDIRQS